MVSVPRVESPRLPSTDGRHDFVCPPVQKISFPANHHCRCPPVPPRLAFVVTSVEVMAPKFAALMFAFGLLKCGVLVTPKASASNWKVNHSRSLKFLIRLMSRLK